MNSFKHATPRFPLFILLIMHIFMTHNAFSADAIKQKGKAENHVWSKELPAGTYALDKTHASLVFTVSHLGFSDYTGQFQLFDATLEFDPAKPENTKVTASIDVTSLTIPKPPEGFLKELLGEHWFDSKKHPQMVFRSIDVKPLSDTTAELTGGLQFLGQTHPVTLHVRFNGGYKGFEPYDMNARVGFSAKGSLKRSGWGMSTGLPPEGSTMGVGDEVRFQIEAEFSGPALSPSN